MNAQGSSTEAALVRARMRADATKAENLLWQELRRNQLGGFKFRRQVPIDGRIVDFVCYPARLIVEVDGGQHSESAADVERDRRFASQGFRILRFWNDEVVRDVDGTCRTILHHASILPRASERGDPLSCDF